MTLMSGQASLWQLGLLVLWLLAHRLMATTTDDLEQLLAQAVLDCLHAAHLTRKEAAAVMGIDEAQFNRQLRAEPMNHLSLSRLVRLASAPAGVVFWAHLGPRLAYLVAQRRYEEIADVFRIRG